MPGRKKSAARLDPAKRAAINSAAFRAVRTLLDDPFKDKSGKMSDRPITDDDVNQIINGLADGKLVIETCRDIGVLPSSFYHVTNRNPEVRQRFDIARQMYAHVMFERNIINTELLLEQDHSEEGAAVAVAAARQIDNVYRWSMGKLNAHAYGDKVTNVHVGDPENPIHTRSENKDTTELSAQELLEQLKNRNRNI